MFSKLSRVAEPRKKKTKPSPSFWTLGIGLNLAKLEPSMKTGNGLHSSCWFYIHSRVCKSSSKRPRSDTINVTIQTKFKTFSVKIVYHCYGYCLITYGTYIYFVILSPLFNLFRSWLSSQLQHSELRIIALLSNVRRCNNQSF